MSHQSPEHLRGQISALCGAVAEIGRIAGRREAYDAIEKLRNVTSLSGADALETYRHGRRVAFERILGELRAGESGKP